VNSISVENLYILAGQQTVFTVRSGDSPNSVARRYMERLRENSNSYLMPAQLHRAGFCQSKKRFLNGKLDSSDLKASVSATNRLFNI
jgi:hypothetical protein